MNISWAQKKNMLNTKADNIESYIDFKKISMLFIYIPLSQIFDNQLCRL
jgi:hypothetical protein